MYGIATIKYYKSNLVLQRIKENRNLILTIYKNKSLFTILKNNHAKNFLPYT